MNFRDFRVGWRLLLADPAYTAVVVLGLSVGFAACFLLLGYVRLSLNYDSHVPDRSQVYVVNERLNLPGSSLKWNTGTSLAAFEPLARLGEVSASRMYSFPASIQIENVVSPVVLSAVDPAFEEIMGVRSREGSLRTAITQPDSIALTASAAERLFPNTRAVGSSVRIAGVPYQVAALLPDPPAETTVPYEALVGISTSTWANEDRAKALQNWGDLRGSVYVKLRQGASTAGVEKIIQDEANNSPLRGLVPPEVLSQLGERNLIDVRLQRLSDAYFDPGVETGANSLTHGSWPVVLALAAIAVLILLLASVNYVNLATVRTLHRQREIAVRKAFGASVGRVIAQFLSESVLVSLVASVLGLVFAFAAAPAVGNLVNRKLTGIFSADALLVSLAVAVALGALAGVFPALAASRIPASYSLSGTGRSESAGGVWLRRALTLLQFAVAMGLISFALAVAWQISYATGRDPGFDSRNLLVVDLPRRMKDGQSVGFRDAIARMRDVVGVTESTGAVGRSGVRYLATVQRAGSESVSLEFKGVGPDFFRVYGVSLVAGRLFSTSLDQVEKSDVVVLNTAAVQALGYASPADAVGTYLEPPRARSNLKMFVGQSQREAPLQIVGIASNIHYQTMRQQTRPLMYVLTDQTSILTIKAGNNIEGVQAEISKAWGEYFPNELLKLDHAASLLALGYADDIRLVKLLTAAASVGLVIAAFGMYVLAAYNVQRRRNEIVLRKIYGAGPIDVARVFLNEIVLTLAFSASLGLVAGYIASQSYLASFVERAPMGVWPFAVAFVTAASVALAATFRHTWSAMYMKPTEAFTL